jgi:hypothetical protein
VSNGTAGERTPAVSSVVAGIRGGR